MNSENLENLVRAGHLKTQDTNYEEVSGLLRSGHTRLADAKNLSLSSESRFDLAYNAAHSIALAALRNCGYRASNRYIVFQSLPHTANVGSEIWRVLAKCHDQRNLAEYEGFVDIDEKLLKDLLKVTEQLLGCVEVILRK